MYTPTEIFKSIVVSMHTDCKASLSSSDNYWGIYLFNSICKLFDNVLFYYYIGPSYQHLICNLNLKQDIIRNYVL